MNSIDYKERDASKVEQMFSGIAARYDFLNHLLSFGFDFGWRKKVARETRGIRCERILDVCTGTGDMAIELFRYWKGTAKVEGIDFSPELLEIAKKKAKKFSARNAIVFGKGNAEKLPYGDNQFDAITIAFGLRNVNNRLKALKEFYRVTRPGGCFICLEFSRPRNEILSRIYFFYLIKIVPHISSIFGSNPEAYRYLSNTIKDFPAPDALVDFIKSAGWNDVSYRILSGGIVAIHTGRKY